MDTREEGQQCRSADARSLDAVRGRRAVATAVAAVFCRKEEYLHDEKTGEDQQGEGRNDDGRNPGEERASDGDLEPREEAADRADAPCGEEALPSQEGGELRGIVDLGKASDAEHSREITIERQGQELHGRLPHARRCGGIGRMPDAPVCRR